MCKQDLLPYSSGSILFEAGMEKILLEEPLRSANRILKIAKSNTAELIGHREASAILHLHSLGSYVSDRLN
jgi:hypothetical protein